jgi:hypothetical protein
LLLRFYGRWQDGIPVDERLPSVGSVVKAKVRLDRGAHMCIHLGIAMGDVDWDPRKAAANVKKHGVDFADAATVLYDDRAITIRDDDEDEERYVTIGMDALGRLLVVVYTWRADRPRLISARPATARERRQYEGKR